VYELQNSVAGEARRLLRILLIWVGQMPADSGAEALLHLADK